jgi:GNAT superfamily N-acetyltransferase
VAADEPFLRDLFASTRPDAAGWPEEIRDLLLAQQFEAQRTGWNRTYPGSEHDLILLGELPVGRVWAHWPSAECLVVDLALLPSYRRQGIGAQIVGQLLERADKAGIRVRAHVERSNSAASAFWSRRGDIRRSGLHRNSAPGR